MRKISLFDERKSRKEEFGENYCTTYEGTFAEFAQAQRHRTLQYKIRLLDEVKFYIPEIIENNEELKKMWLEDMNSLADLYPQGMLIQINERGTAENFILKCKERVCGCAQLEIMKQTYEILNKYIENTKETNEEIYNYLLLSATVTRDGQIETLIAKTQRRLIQFARELQLQYSGFDEIKKWILNYITEAAVSAVKAAAGKTSN